MFNQEDSIRGNKINKKERYPKVPSYNLIKYIILIPYVFLSRHYHLT